MTHHSGAWSPYTGDSAIIPSVVLLLVTGMLLYFLADMFLIFAVWAVFGLCLSGNSSANCSEHDLKSSGVCYCRLAFPSVGKKRMVCPSACPGQPVKQSMTRLTGVVRKEPSITISSIGQRGVAVVEFIGFPIVVRILMSVAISSGRAQAGQTLPGLHSAKN